jgi:hypothetical protein
MEGTSHFSEEKSSFKEPLEAASAACVAGLRAAAKTVKGAEARTRAALDDLESLEQFQIALQTRMRERSFHILPGLRRGRDVIHGAHVLTTGPWRAIFLVDDRETMVVGLIFSKYPHDLERRFDEIAANYRPATGKPQPPA